MNKIFFVLISFVLCSCEANSTELPSSTSNNTDEVNVVTPGPVLQLSDLHTYENYGTLYVTGSATNISDKTLNDVNPWLDTYTADDAHIEEFYGTMEFDTLLPGQTATFDITLYQANPLTAYGMMHFNQAYTKALRYDGEGKIEITIPGSLSD